jgi:hypothetical protein
MKTDVAGRIKNVSLAASKSLLPLYEAVVNSIQAIEDAGETNGHIEIAILRDNEHLYGEQEPEIGEIVGFEVIDNGIGFNDDNYHAFETSDTTYKAKRGGKGIGRFMWLVAFERVEVLSHFEKDGKMFCRQFGFIPEGDGIRNMSVTDSTEEERRTSIRLIGLRTKYQQQCPKKRDTIATHMIEHCLEYFIRSDCPNIMIANRGTNDRITLNDQFEHEMAMQSKRDQISIEDHNFEVLHVRLHSSHVKDHQLHFCADSRVVKSEKLHGRLPNLSRHLEDQDGRAFVYAAYVDSKILDESVNAERTDFSIAEDDSELLLKTITWQSIRDAVFETCRNFLKPYTDPVREYKKKRIEDFIATDGPMYRPILKYIEDKIDLIDPEISDNNLDLRLYQAYHELQVGLHKQGQQLLQQDIKDEEWEAFLSQLQGYFDKVTDINKSDLARYVCHRRAVLDFLSKQLSLADDGKYRREERVHQIIFPLRKTTDDVFFDDHNLWLLDEKLIYQSFLASDKPLRNNPQVSTNSRREPDLIAFDKACAFTMGSEFPFSAITIIEFKRPMRDNYKADENPFVQVRQYMVDIQEGKARMSDGRDIPIGKDIPFCCYIVSDITPTLQQQAYDFELTRTPDGQGFFGYKRQYNAYVEVISYTKMVADAKKRNAAFFDKLGLPARIGQ